MTDTQNILITGAASGIGRASAKRMAETMHVVVADRDADGAAETVAMIAAALAMRSPRATVRLMSRRT